MRIVAVGRLRAGPEAALFARYAARLRPPPEVTEVAEASGPPAVAKAREGQALLAAVPASGFVVALDQGGTAPDSAAFAVLLARWAQAGRPLCFLIGGAEGLDRSVLARAGGAAGAVLSLGPLTWPHLLARALLAEQLYRAQTIAGGHPYHRAGRP